MYVNQVTATIIGITFEVEAHIGSTSHLIHQPNKNPLKDFPIEISSGASSQSFVYMLLIVYESYHLGARSKCKSKMKLTHPLQIVRYPEYFFLISSWIIYFEVTIYSELKMIFLFEIWDQNIDSIVQIFV